MLIILEGPDGSGKTTLAHELVRGHGFKYKHHGPPQKDPLCEYLETLTQVENEGGNWVVDRFHLGEQVYGPLLREDKLGLAGRIVIEQLATQFNAIVVLCLPPLDVVLTHLKTTDRYELIGADRAAQVHAGFSSVKTDLPVVVYDRTVHEPVHFAKELASSKG